MTTKTKDATTRIRIPRHVREIVGQAAAIQGKTDTDFLVSVLSEAAHKVIASDSVIHLCPEDQLFLVEALRDGKQHPAPRKLVRLRRAVRDHAKNVESV